jgi:hypothetical protein
VTNAVRERQYNANLGLVRSLLAAAISRLSEPDSKDNYRASRLTAIWMQASVTKAARVIDPRHADRLLDVLPSTSRITASVENDAVNHATIPSAIPF